MKLTPTMEKFILHWGEMGTRWGINRTVAQIHALLYVSPKPLPADEIAETLSVARSNVSTGLRELQGWGIVRASHILGDRRDHFEATGDVWEIFRAIMDERKKREIDPTLRLLRECVEEADRGSSAEKQASERWGSLLQLMQTLSDLYQEVRDLPLSSAARLAHSGLKLKKWLGLRGK